MAGLQPTQVFIPNGYPEHTYVARDGKQHEQALRKGLSWAGFLVSVLGPSKSGKTILLRNVLGDAQVRVSGSAIASPQDLWRLALSEMHEPVAREKHLDLQDGRKRVVDAHASGGLPVLQAGAGIEIAREKGRTVSYSERYAEAGMGDAIAALMERNKVLVIDDFHYIPGPARVKIAQQLKEALERGLKIAVLEVPHRGDDPIRANPDERAILSG